MNGWIDSPPSPFVKSILNSATDATKRLKIKINEAGNAAIYSFGNEPSSFLAKIPALLSHCSQPFIGQAFFESRNSGSLFPCWCDLYRRDRLQ